MKTLIHEAVQVLGPSSSVSFPSDVSKALGQGKVIRGRIRELAQKNRRFRVILGIVLALVGASIGGIIALLGVGIVTYILFGLISIFTDWSTWESAVNLSSQTALVIGALIGGAIGWETAGGS